MVDVLALKYRREFNHFSYKVYEMLII